jgi:ParB-like chromosome segregation protein Spo0J
VSTKQLAESSRSGSPTMRTTQADSSYGVKRLEIPIALIPIERIQPHPLNPRPWSERYRARVHEDKVDRLMTIIGTNGYDPTEPITVRQTAPGEYQIIMGHHRYCAMRELGHVNIPCTIVAAKLTALDAALMMLTRQGKAIEPWYAAEHAYQLCEVQGLKQSEYARATGYELSVINKWVCAYRVRAQTKNQTLSVTISALVARLPEADWGWAVTAIGERQWSSRRVDIAVKAVNAMRVPISCEHWLPIDKWKRKVWSDDSGTLNREITNWIDTYQRSIDTIGIELPAVIADPSGDEPLNPIVLFDRLMAREPVPTQFKIELAKSAVIKTGRELLGLECSRPPVVSVELSGKQLVCKAEGRGQKAEVQDSVALSPFPFPLSPLLSSALCPLPSAFDVAILDLRGCEQVQYPSLPIHPNGRLLILTDPATSYQRQSESIALGWQLQEKLIWSHISSDDRGQDRFRQVYDEILVYSQGKPDYFGYAQLRDTPKLERQTSNCIQISSKGTNIPPLLARLLIAAYVPPGGSIYHHQTTDGTVAIAAQKLDRHGYWSSNATDHDEISLQILRG